MPAIRSSKGKANNNNNNNLNNNDKGKGKAPATRPRKVQNNNVDPCEICGVVVSRKSDIARHAKIHDPHSKKLPCPWEGCTYSARQKTNLNTHYRRHTQEKDCICKDDPDKCGFDCVDASSLLRHRKRFHGYIPRSAPRNRVKKPKKKRVPIRVIRGIEGDSPGSASAATLSQFHAFHSVEASESTSGSSLSRPFSAEASTSRLSSPRPFKFSAEASTSGSYSSPPFYTGASTSRSSSSRPYYAEASTSLAGSYSSRPLSLPESPTSPPILMPVPPCESSSSSSSSSPSASGSRPPLQSRLRTYSPAHSSGEVSPTPPVTSTIPKGHVYVDPSCPFPPEVLDGSCVSSPWGRGSEMLDYQYHWQHPVEVVYDTISMENELLSPSFPDKGKEWTEVSVAGSFLGPDGVPFDEEHQPLSSSSPMCTQHHPIHIGSYHQTQNSPIEGFYYNAYQSHSLALPGPSQFPSPTPLGVAVANLDMMMSLDVNNQSYCHGGLGYDTGIGDMSLSPHGFGNMSV